MAGRYQAYVRLTDEVFSGIADEIPGTWISKKVKFLLKPGKEGLRIGPFGSSLKLEDMVESGIRVFGQENVIKENFSVGSRFISNEKYAELHEYTISPGDILVTTMGTTGRVIVVPDSVDCGIMDSHLVRMRINSEVVDSRFLQICLSQSSIVSGQVKLLGKGSIMHGLNSTIIRELVVPLPSPVEQKTIARFLDHETAKIDELIAKQERLIELLKEKRQAVISHAVTKGLNPDAPMKDSGVEWLGEVPEHWGIKCLKHAATSLKAGPFGSALTKDKYSSAGYRVYGQEQVIPGDFSIGDYYISEEVYAELQQYSVVAGDVLISCVGSFGKIACFPESGEPGIINPRLIRVRPNHNLVQSEYLELVLRSRVIFEQMSVASRGGTMDVVNIGILSELVIPLPTLREQTEILGFAQREFAKYDRGIELGTAQIQLLKERRTALISAAVTGKIDVRNWKPDDNQ